MTAVYAIGLAWTAVGGTVVLATLIWDARQGLYPAPLDYRYVPLLIAIWPVFTYVLARDWLEARR